MGKWNWHRGSFNITLRTGEVQEVDGVVISGVLPSLGVHMASPGVYDVTHIPTGRKVIQPGFYTFPQAMAYTEAILQRHPWGLSDPRVLPEEQVELQQLAAEFRL